VIFIAAIEAVPRIEPPSKAEPPVDPVAPPGRPVRTNRGHAVRWRICLGIVGILGIIGAGGRSVSVERIAELTRQQAAAAEKAHDEEQARQAAAKSQVEDALKNGSGQQGFRRGDALAPHGRGSGKCRRAVTHGLVL